MKKIQSFCVDHNKLKPGIYISRIDDDIVTYDLRFIKPNTASFLTPESSHTIEHLFATYVRNSKLSKHVIYFGPMGCLTGFYFIVRGLSHKKAISLIKDTIDKCISHTGKIPGSLKIECGNYKFHDRKAAKSFLLSYKNTIKDITENDIFY